MATSGEPSADEIASAAIAPEGEVVSMHELAAIKANMDRLQQEVAALRETRADVRRRRRPARLHADAHARARSAEGLAAVQRIPDRGACVLRSPHTGQTTGAEAACAVETAEPGHGSEADYAHPVIRTGFEQLRAMLDGPMRSRIE